MSDHTYPCHNHPPHGGDLGPISVQDGWTDDGRRVMRTHHPRWAAIECGHQTPEADPCCTGCRWLEWERSAS
jgi:hypothetical protein